MDSCVPEGRSVKMTRVMKKAADTSTTDKDPDRADQARNLFLVTLFDLSWRLAAAFLVPTLLGVAADRVFGTDPALTIVGVVLGVLAAGYTVRKVIEDLPKGESN